MAEKEDDFDFDIYGDDSAQTYEEGDQQPTDPNAVNTGDGQYEESYQAQDAQVGDDSYQMTEETQAAAAEGQEGDHQHYDASEGVSNASAAMQSDQVQQGTKRKSGDDAETPVDPAATSALSLNELNWWTSEDEIRGWANECGVEDQLRELTFNEHKVNGKSKGQAFVEFASAAAATAVKHRIDSLDTKENLGKKFIASYHAPNMNPYKNPPKDIAGRKDHGPGSRNASGHMGQNPRGGMSSYGGRGNFQNRGGMGYQNRNYNQGMNTGMASGFGGNMGFQGGMNSMGNFGNFNRGGMMGGMRGGMGGRGGRGGMGGGFNPMMGMGGMAMGMPNMPMGMGMGNMGGTMNPSYPPFQPPPYGSMVQDPYTHGFMAQDTPPHGFMAQDTPPHGFMAQDPYSHDYMAQDSLSQDQMAQQPSSSGLQCGNAYAYDYFAQDLYAQGYTPQDLYSFGFPPLDTSSSGVTGQGSSQTFTSQNTPPSGFTASNPSFSGVIAQGPGAPIPTHIGRSPRRHSRWNGYGRGNYNQYVVPRMPQTPALEEDRGTPELSASIRSSSVPPDAQALLPEWFQGRGVMLSAAQTGFPLSELASAFQGGVVLPSAPSGHPLSVLSSTFWGGVESPAAQIEASHFEPISAFQGGVMLPAAQTGAPLSEVGSAFQGGVRLSEAQIEAPRFEAGSAFQDGVQLPTAHAGVRTEVPLSEVGTAFQGGVSLSEAQTGVPPSAASSVFQGGVRLSAYKPLSPPQDHGYAAPSQGFRGQYPGFSFAILHNVN